MGVNVAEASPAPTEAEQLKLGVIVAPGAQSRPASVAEMSTVQNQEDAPPCSMCGSIMVRSGSCYKCVNCGSTSGCA